MSFRTLFFGLLALIVVGIVGFFLLPALLGSSSSPGASSIGSSTVATNDPRRLNFIQSVNDLGDRIYLTTSVTITLTPQSTGPDKVMIAANGGARSGTFRFTITPHQGSRGVRRAIGEFDLGGQVFRLCEVVDDPAGGLPAHAERFAPVNSGGSRYSLPVPMPATTFVSLITAAVGGTPPGSSNKSFSPTAETQRLAESLVVLCTGQ